MLRALNGATTMHASLGTDIRVAAEAGYDLVEIWASKMDDYLKTGTVTELGQLFAAYRVNPYSINSIERITFRDATGREQVREQTRALCARAQALHCPYIVVVPSEKPAGVSRQDIFEESVQTLQVLSDIAKEYDIGLAFEMLGFPACSVNTLADAWAIVKTVDRPNVGIVLDTFHFYVGGSSLASIVDIDPKKLFIFHINDAEKGPRETLTDAKRLLPGEGVIPLGDICRGLRNIGYKHMVSIELFRPEYWEWDPLRLAQAAKNAMDKIVTDVWG